MGRECGLCGGSEGLFEFCFWCKNAAKLKAMKIFLLCFFYKLMSESFMFRPVILFELIFVYDAKYGSDVTFLLMEI